MEGHDEELTIDVPEPLPESSPTLEPPAITTVGTEEQWEKLIQQNQESNKALVVDFRSTWCKPSLVIAPFFEELSGRFPAAVFASVDVDELKVQDKCARRSIREAIHRCPEDTQQWLEDNMSNVETSRWCFSTSIKRCNEESGESGETGLTSSK